MKWLDKLKNFFTRTNTAAVLRTTPRPSPTIKRRIQNARLRRVCGGPHPDRDACLNERGQLIFDKHKRLYRVGAYRRWPEQIMSEA